MHLAQNIKYLRGQRKMKQNDLAEIIGVGQPTVGNWEAGRREPKLNMLIHIADHFGVTLDQLVKQDLSKEDRNAGNELQENADINNQCDSSTHQQL